MVFDSKFDSKYEFYKHLREIIGYSQGNHHAQMVSQRLAGISSGSMHTGRNWQSCKSPSCVYVAPTWRYLKKMEDRYNPFVVKQRGY